MTQHRPNGAQPADDRDVAIYVAAVAGELRTLAQRRTRLRTLAYLLDMARLEAERAAQEEERR